MELDCPCLVVLVKLFSALKYHHGFFITLPYRPAQRVKVISNSFEVKAVSKGN